MKNIINLYRMSIIVNKNGKIVRGSSNPPVISQQQPKSQTNWIDHTKSYAYNNDMSFGQSLSSKDNRCQYYDTMIDRNMYNRGSGLLQLDHPAMHHYIPNLSPSDKNIFPSYGAIRREIHIPLKIYF